LDLWPSWPPRDSVSISFTSLAEYDECPRRWLNQHASDLLSDDTKWDIRAESRLAPWDALAGRVVDDTIRWALNEYVSTEEWPAELMTKANEILRQYVVYSRQFKEAVRSKSKWPRSLDTQPVDKLFFADELTDMEKGRVRIAMRNCLANFLASGIPEFITAFPTTDWIIPNRKEELDAIPWFLCGGIPVYASYDFVIRSAHLTMIFDWKTGKRNRWTEEKVREQLHMYAELAHGYWEVPLEEISLFPVWLAYEVELKPIELSEPFLDRLRVKWADRHALLTARLCEAKEDPERLPDLFPITEDFASCARCKFRSCPGHQRLLESGLIIREGRNLDRAVYE
jgi:hypothetical protein